MTRDEAMAITEFLEDLVTSLEKGGYTPGETREAFDLSASRRGLDPEPLRARFTAIVHNEPGSDDDFNDLLAWRRKSLS